MTLFGDDICLSRGQGGKPQKWKHPPIMNDFYDSATTGTEAIGVQAMKIRTGSAIIHLAARDMQE